MLSMRKPSGITLVEVLVSLVVMSCLLLVGTPSFTRWIQETQLRAAAESIQTGLQLARGEAVRRNQPVRFQLDGVGGLVEWQVGCPSPGAACPARISAQSSGEFGRNARAAATAVAADAANYRLALAPGSGLPFSVDFDGLGAVVGGNGGRIDVSNAALQVSLRLCIVVGGNGLIRLCNPDLARAANPQGCE
jgi:type IV fimbrial biogenesis protein FimT